MVFQDVQAHVDEDGPFRVPIVFNLTHQRSMPMSLGH
jgi:hypothetical protein